MSATPGITPAVPSSQLPQQPKGAQAGHSNSRLLKTGNLEEADRIEAECTNRHGNIVGPAEVPIESESDVDETMSWEDE